jgi:hypothetical protein
MYIRFIAKSKSRTAKKINGILNKNDLFDHVQVSAADLKLSDIGVVSRYGLKAFKTVEISDANWRRLTPTGVFLALDALYRAAKFPFILRNDQRFRAALAGTKYEARFHQVYARALMLTGKLGAARAVAREANGSSIGIVMLRADLADAMSDMPAARYCYEKALRADPNNAKLRVRYGWHLMKLGASDPKRGINLTLAGMEQWALADKRWGTFPNIKEALPWRGENLNGKSLYVLFQYGLGDMVQFARFIPVLKERWPNVYVCGEAPEVLHGFLKRRFGLNGVDSAYRRHRQIDYYCGVSQLAAILDVQDFCVPAAASDCERQLPADRPLRVGFCWRGHPREYDLIRSVPLKTFANLFEGRHTFVNLLNKMTEPETQILAGDPNVECPAIADVEDLAREAEACDVVVSVDTAVTHVAASVGTPVLLLCRPDSCWRWGYRGTETNWYPNVKVFRHPGDLDWDAVLENVRRELRRHEAEPAVLRTLPPSAEDRHAQQQFVA